MTDIESIARAEAEAWREAEQYAPGDLEAQDDYVQGYLAASRREPSEPAGECDQCGEPFSEHSCIPIPSCIHVPEMPDIEDDEEAEVSDLEDIAIRDGDKASAIVRICRGDSPPLTSWSTHDVVELVQALHDRAEKAEQERDTYAAKLIERG